MDYRIYNESCIKDTHYRKKTKDIIKSQVKRLNRVTKNYPKPLVVQIHFNQYKKRGYHISALVNLKEHVVLITENGDRPDICINRLFNRLKVSLTEKINKERKEYLYNRKNKRFKAFYENLSYLQDLKNENEKEFFNHLLGILLKDVSDYIKRRLKSAQLTSAVKRGKFKPEELLDELYLQIYDNIDKMPANEKDTIIWIYRLADELLNRLFDEIQFEKENIDRIENIVEEEYKTMEERFTVDADEKIIPVEELDEFGQQADKYAIKNTLYPENEESLIDEITLN